MNSSKAQARLRELDEELEQLSAIHYDIECEIEDLEEKRKRFMKKWRAVLPRKAIQR